MIICPDCSKEKEKLEENCSNCGATVELLEGILVQLSEKDKKRELFQDYRKLYSKVALDDLEKSIQHPEYLEIQTNKLFKYLPKEKGQAICEVGVGQGWLIKKLATLSPSRLVGVDIASPYLQKLKQSNIPYEPVIANAENLPFKEEFDLIVSADVLEHVLSVGNYLHSIRESLKMGGTFVVRTPYLEDYTVYSRHDNCPYDLVHLRNFSKKTLKIILEGAGFKIKQIYLDGFQDHKIRFPSDHFLGKVIRKIIYRIYDGYLDLPRIPNWIGKILMRPCEINVVCERIK